MPGIPGDARATDWPVLVPAAWSRQVNGFICWPRELCISLVIENQAAPAPSHPPLVAAAVPRSPPSGRHQTSRQQESLGPSRQHHLPGHRLWPGHVIRRAGRHGHDGQPPAWAYCGASPYSFSLRTSTAASTWHQTFHLPIYICTAQPTSDRTPHNQPVHTLLLQSSHQLPTSPTNPPFLQHATRLSKQALRYNSSPAFCLRECTVTWHRLICLAHHVTLPHSAPSLMQHAVAFPSLKCASLTCTSHLRRDLYEVWTGCMVIYGPIKGQE